MFIQDDLSSEDSTVLPFALKTIPCFRRSLDAFEIGNFFHWKWKSDLRAKIRH